MSFLDEVRAKRQKLADVLSDEDYSGIREIVEELYPDQAHFIYELLQNAEDAGASEASFSLETNSVIFEHNGDPFTECNVRDITNIGKSRKRDQEGKIGRFGIGFKSVFAYSETPHIWSPSFSFKICELVLPTAIDANQDLGDKTRFEFPFNNPKKSARTAYDEVRAGLEELAETTLLFLSNLKSIRWQIDSHASGEVLRIHHSENHIEVRKQTDDKKTASSHFLRFSCPVDGLEKQRVAVAFELDYLPNVTAFNPKKALAKQLKIVPAKPGGRVSVFFPAKNETSGLRFHVHAPFVPELSRASIKETTANAPLFAQLAKLAAKSLHSIREFELLSGEFLGVLPNPQDSVPLRYQPIRSAIIEEMNREALTPTHLESHAPARHLLQAKASLKDLLSLEDLAFLVDNNDQPPQWAIGASQKHSNVDRFLSGLAIEDWDIAKFVETLKEKATAGSWQEPDGDFIQWLSAKPIAWHQQMYSLLYDELSCEAIAQLKDVHIIRMSDGSYSVGSKCFFPSDGLDHDEAIPRVDKRVYSSGKNERHQELAREFLEEVGVREVSEADQILSILKQRYSEQKEGPDDKTYLQDLKRFIELVEKEPVQSKMFSKFRIFKRAGAGWATPAQVYLDSPFLETDLSAYYNALGDAGGKTAISVWYENHKTSIPLVRISEFARSVEVQSDLPIEKCTCEYNAMKDYLYGAEGKRKSAHGEDCDYFIPYLHKVIEAKSIKLSRLIWNTMCRNSAGKLKATYKKSRSSEQREKPALLLNWLSNRAWIPQADQDFVRPSEASRYLLPKGFPFDEEYEWLKAISFGENERQQTEVYKKKQATARELGFPDENTLADAQWFAGLDGEDRQRFRDQIQKARSFELPEEDSRNPDRRAERVAQQAAQAPERTVEDRLRSVTVGEIEIKQQAKLYLRARYTTDGETICQVCKSPLPFKLDDGSYYFEAVKFLRDLKKLHRQNYLALCPNHSAMFEYANGSRDVMKEKFLQIEGQELEIILAQKPATIRFNKLHSDDLRNVIKGENARDGAGGDAADEDGSS